MPKKIVVVRKVQRNRFRKNSTYTKNRILRWLRRGKFIEEAAQRARVSVRAVSYWRQQDPAFHQDVRTAISEGCLPVKRKLRQSAEEGQEWAIKFYLRNRDQLNWSEGKAASVEEMRAQAIEDIKTIIDIVVGAVKRYVTDETIQDRIRAAIIEKLPGEPDSIVVGETTRAIH